MTTLLPMKRKDASALLKKIDEQYGIEKTDDLLDKYVFYKSEKDKVFIINAVIKDVDLKHIRLNNLGLYFCEENEFHVRLSIEGSQLLGPFATKNIIELSDYEAMQWMSGEDLPCSEKIPGFALVKSGERFLGTGKCKDDLLFNFVNKGRRIQLSE